ncbi:acid-resistance protein, partial [Klebsiella quasipneumoniae]
MFMFSHYTLNAFNPRVFIRYKRHAGLMAALLFICGACCLAWPLVAGWYLATVTGMLLMICGFYS